MRRTLLAAILATFSIAALAASDTQTKVVSAQEGAVAQCQWIEGYFRSDGTFVQGHWRGC